ncbi:MAG: stalk domain-containing protein [Caldisericota bacterium]|nr:stalk domain-containing protein [Caldisericota bacterium]
MKKLLIFFILIVLVLTPLYARAGEDFNWGNAKDINGGIINSIALSRNFSADKTAYASTDAAIFASSDAGKTWDKLPFSFTEGANIVFISKTFRENAIILGTKDGVYISENKGKYWQVFNRGMKESYIIDIAEDSEGNLFALSFNGNLMQRNRDNDYWKTVMQIYPAATTITVSQNYIYTGCEEGTIYKINPSSKEKEAIAKNITESPISKLLVHNSTIYASTFYDGMFIGNKGDFAHELSGIKINDFAIENGKIFVATIDKGLMVKNGEWKTISKLDDVAIKCMTISNNFTTDNTIFIGTIGKGIFRSINAGITFTKSSYGITATSIVAVGFSSTYSTDGTVFVGTKRNGLYESTDFGKTFSYVPSFTSHYSITSICTTNNFTETQTVYVGTEGDGLFISEDNGKIFQKLNVLPTQYISALFYTDSRTLIVGTGNNGIFTAKIQDSFFTQSNNGILPFDMNIISIAGSGDTIFIGTNGGGLYKSTNSGESWGKIGDRDIPPYSISDISLSSNYTSDHTLLVGTTGSGIFISKNGGLNFTNISDALLKNYMWVDGAQLSPNFSADHIIFAGSWDGVYLSTDSGNNWSNITGNKDNRYVYKVYFTPDFQYKKSGALYVATESGSLYILNQKEKTIIKLWPDNPKMTVNGVSKEIDIGRGTKPVIIPKWERTVVPIRAIVEALGGTISWESKTRKVTINFETTTIELWIDNPKAKVNGAEVWIDTDNHDVKPIIVNDRTMLPLRFVAESLGCDVGWDNDTRTITITYGG